MRIDCRFDNIDNVRLDVIDKPIAWNKSSVLNTVYKEKIIARNFMKRSSRKLYVHIYIYNGFKLSSLFIKFVLTIYKIITRSNDSVSLFLGLNDQTKCTIKFLSTINRGN